VGLVGFVAQHPVREPANISLEFAVIGFIANIFNLISLAQFIISLRNGSVGSGPVTTFYLPFPLEQ
jgi:hypothetical protein